MLVETTPLTQVEQPTGTISLAIFRLRGHNLKLVNSRCHYDLRKYSFTVRIVNTWNSLPESVISAGTIDTFKNRLDKFWHNQDILLDYKANLTGIGNRREKNEEDFI